MIFWIHFKKVDTIIFSEISLNAQMIHETISSSNGFWCSVTVKAWIPSAIYCNRPFHYSRKTKGYRTKANLRGSRAEFKLSFAANTAVTFQSRDLQRCHRQAAIHILPSHACETANTSSLIF